MLLCSWNRSGEAERLSRDLDALLWGDGVNYLRSGNAISCWFTYAVKRAQKTDAEFPRVTPHDLRYTAASLAISVGGNVKALQRMLGHASAAMTLDRYADLFEDDLDAVDVVRHGDHRRLSWGGSLGRKK